MKQLSNLQFFLTIIIFGLPFQDLFGQGVPIKRSIFAQNAWVMIVVYIKVKGDKATFDFLFSKFYAHFNFV